MPTYATPTPIDLAVNLQVGEVEVVASERTDAVVTVSPSNPGKAVDRRGAEETKVDFDGHVLTVKGPRPRLSWIGPSESVDLRIELPAGSRLTAEIAMGAVRTSGRLGATRIKSSMGSVDVESSDDLWLRAGHGNVTVGTADGGVDVTADHGQIRLGTVTGDALLKASHGSIQLGESGGDVDAKLAYGDLEIDRALGSVTTRISYGSVRLHEVSSGSIEVESGYGQVDIGVRAGIPAWLDLSSKSGHVRNQLGDTRAPGGSEQSVAVRARTQSGGIDVRRAQ